MSLSVSKRWLRVRVTTAVADGGHGEHEFLWQDDAGGCTNVGRAGRRVCSALVTGAQVGEYRTRFYRGELMAVAE